MSLSLWGLIETFPIVTIVAQSRKICCLANYGDRQDKRSLISLCGFLGHKLRGFTPIWRSLIPGVYTINAAYRIARGEGPIPNSPHSAGWDWLLRAWNTAGEADRQRFCQELGLVEGE
jgi:hypothetical protein